MKLLWPEEYAPPRGSVFDVLLAFRDTPELFYGASPRLGPLALRSLNILLWPCMFQMLGARRDSPDGAPERGDPRDAELFIRNCPGEFDVAAFYRALRHVFEAQERGDIRLDGGPIDPPARTVAWVGGMDEVAPALRRLESGPIVRNLAWAMIRALVEVESFRPREPIYAPAVAVVCARYFRSNEREARAYLVDHNFVNVDDDNKPLEEDIAFLRAHGVTDIAIMEWRF